MLIGFRKVTAIFLIKTRDSQSPSNHPRDQDGFLIQVDIGGHPPFPNGSKWLSRNFGNLLFLVGFNFRGHFEGPNEGF